MTKRNDRVYQHESSYVRSNSRNSRDAPSSKGVIRTYKDFTSYSNEVENSSALSDLPSKGVKRSSKITSLQQEFQDLKKKIREVQNKNQKIIEKISFSKDVQKRKNEQMYQHMMQQLSEENPSYSQVLPPNARGKWPQIPQPQKNKVPLLSLYQSEKEPKSQIDLRHKDSYPIRKVNQSADMGTIHDEGRQKNKLKVDIIALQDKYSKQQSKFQHLKNNFKNYSDCVKLIFQNQLGQFMDNISNVMSVIQGKNNRNKERINRLQGRVTTSRNHKRRDMKLSSSFDLGSKRKQKSQIANSESHKAKNKQFQALINKYQQILRTKNDQIQKLTIQIKQKEREIIQMNDRFDQIKEDKRRMGHEHDEMVAKLQGKIQALIQSKPGQNKKKQFINLATSRQRQKQKQKSKQKDRKQQISLSQKYSKQIRILQSKLSFSESRLQQKLKNIQQLQNQIRSNNENKMNLITEYQQTLQRTRASNKNKTDDLSITIQNLKSLIKSKQQIISKQNESFKEFQHKCMQLQIQLNTVNQKLLLKQDIQKLQRSAIKRANQIQIDMPLENISFTNQIYKRQKRQLQYNYDKLKGQFQIYKLSSRSVYTTDDTVKQKDNIIKDLRNKLQKYTTLQSPLLKRSDTNLLQSKVIEQNTFNDLKTKLKIQDDQIFRLKNIIQQLKRQNISVNSKAIGLGHDVTLNEQLHKQQQQKSKQLKLYIEQLQKIVSQLQKLLDSKNKQLQSQKQAYEKQFISIQNELKIMQQQFSIINSELIKQTDKVNIKVLQVKKLQQQNQDYRNQIFKQSQQKYKIQLKLQDLQKDIKKQNILDNKNNQQYKSNLIKFKNQVQKLENQNITLIQINKHQKNKIEQLELEVFNDNQNQDQCISQVSEYKTESMAIKLKTLENISLENDINKANLERYLKNAEENNIKLIEQVKGLESVIEKKKQEYNSIVMNYDQKIHQLEQNLQSAEKALKEQQRGSIDNKQSEQHHNIVNIPNDRVYKSQIRSQSSLMFSNTSQLYGDKEIDFRLSDDGGSQAGQINVEAIFNNVNYPYQNIKLRRKDQVQFIKNTAQLINKLKSTINQKNRKIKVLQRKLSPDKGNDFMSKLTQSLKSDDFDDIQDFNQNYSVRFDDKKYDKSRKLKQLENETHLVMEENNLLLQQVTNLQDEIEKAEEQQNNLVRLKEVLKEEVKKLQKTLDQKDLEHQEAIKKLQKIIQQNEAVHNSQTMRILLPKIFAIIGNQDFIKKQEKRKELEEYIKIVATILRIQFVPIRYSGRR